MENISDLKILRDPFELATGQILNLRFGPLSIYLGHFFQEWRLSWTTTNDYMDNSFDLQNPFTGEIPNDLQSMIRYTYSRPCNRFVKLTPTLGDLPYVARPTKPLMILPNETVCVFMSIPLFVRVETEDPYHLLEDIPVLQSPKTWFGDNTVRGEICYSTKIKAVLNRAELINRPYRAISQLEIYNKSPEPLHVERLKVPAPFLSLFQGDDGLFYTSVMSFVCDVDGAIKNVDIDSEGDAFEDKVLIAGPRLKVNDKSLLHPLSYFFGHQYE